MPELDHIWVKFYDKDKKHIWSARAELDGDKYTAPKPPGDVVYASSKIDGHKLHRLPDWQEVVYG